jgi:hypothetical protein
MMWKELAMSCFMQYHRIFRKGQKHSTKKVSKKASVRVDTRIRDVCNTNQKC